MVIQRSFRGTPRVEGGVVVSAKRHCYSVWRDDLLAETLRVVVQRGVKLLRQCAVVGVASRSTGRIYCG